MLRRWFVVLAVLAVTLGVARSASAEEEVKLGTLAPSDSAWGKVFKAWAKAVEEESNGGLKLTWYFNGTQGDELAMVGKMRSGQLDGGAFTSTGLNQIDSNYGALSMPGLFPDWSKFDAAREQLRPKFDKAFADKGFVILGTGDVGMAHIMSRGGPVRVPDDLKKFHPFYIHGDVIGQKFLEVVGISNPKPLHVPMILPAVARRAEDAHDVINTPAIAAEQLQWAPHFDHINTLPTGIGMGALVMKKDRYDSLPADVRAIMERTGKNTGELLTKRIRGIDNAAFERFKQSKTVVDPTNDEKQQWAAKFKAVRDALRAENKFRGDVMDDVSKAAGL